MPSNVVLAEDFARHFDGFSISSNDLTQLVLGVDRDSEFLVEAGIDSMSLNPDSVLRTIPVIAEAEQATETGGHVGHS